MRQRPDVRPPSPLRPCSEMQRRRAPSMLIVIGVTRTVIEAAKCRRQRPLRDALVLVALFLHPLASSAQERSAQRLLIVKERMIAGHEDAYARNEAQIADLCARSRCPQPYLALQSITTP